MSFKKVEDDIKPILKYNEAARCDDMTLYASYVYDKLKGANTSKDWLVTVFSDRLFRIMHGIAPYETVSRVRRKLQATYEELRAPKDYIEKRKKKEQEYKKYAMQKGGGLNE